MTEAEFLEKYGGLPSSNIREHFAADLRKLLAAEVRPWRERADKLQAFKDFVHRYLSEYGVPEDDPENKHSKEGCRIGARLDLLLSLRKEVEALFKLPNWQRRGPSWSDIDAAMKQTYAAAIRARGEHV